MTEAEIKQEIVNSQNSKRVTNNLQRLILTVAHNSLAEHYRGNYSMRCFQSSLIIQNMLEQFGIKSVVVCGFACVPNVIGQNPYGLSWQGFWGEDHHIWVMTEFCELIDLTIAHLHLHPMNFNHDSQTAPALWWYPADLMPSILKYLPENKHPVLETASQDDFEKLKIVMKRRFSEALETANDNHNFPHYILNDDAAFGELYKRRNNWAIGCYLMQQSDTPLPEEIVKKERKLLAKYRV